MHPCGYIYVILLLSLFYFVEFFFSLTDMVQLCEGVQKVNAQYFPYHKMKIRQLLFQQYFLKILTKIQIKFVAKFVVIFVNYILASAPYCICIGNACTYNQSVKLIFKLNLMPIYYPPLFNNKQTHILRIVVKILVKV